MNIKVITASVVSFVLCTTVYAQEYSVPVQENEEIMQTGFFEPTWESLMNYEVPEWFRDAKFGIWAHWGPQCVEGSGDWMARGMYIEDSNQYKYHLEHYGHPSEVGFKDILPLFKAENWNPEELLRFYKEEVGAEYFFALGNHHDNFDLWDSKYQEWNSVNIGPHRDILKEWSDAAKKVGLRFGISFHADRSWIWYETSLGCDSKGPKAGVKYDGWLTKEDGYELNPDGSEKWWKGFDPQTLYVTASCKDSLNGEPISSQDFLKNFYKQYLTSTPPSILPSQEFVNNFYNRTLDAINRYRPDLIYCDKSVLPLYPYSDVGLKIAAHFYNLSMKDHSGVNTGVMFCKALNAEQRKAIVWDVERGAPNEIIPEPWQCDNCIGGWHYNTSIYENNRYKSAATVAKLLVDIVSKNGNMLLSVPLRGDGTPDEKEIAILKEFGAWMKVNKESIVKTRPWKKFGEGPVAEADIKIKSVGFNDQQYMKAGAAEIRFTTTSEYLYATALAWPEDGIINIRSLSKGNPLCPEKIKQVELLGYGKVKFTRTPEALTVILPEDCPNKLLPVLKIR